MPKGSRASDFKALSPPCGKYRIKGLFFSSGELFCDYWGATVISKMLRGRKVAYENTIQNAWEGKN